MTAGAGGQDYTFEAFAGHDFYRRVNEHLVDAALQIWERLPSGPLRRALDLACGTGAVTQVLVDRVRRLREPVEIIGVDSSDSALEKARRLIGNAASFVRGTADHLSSVASNVDLILFCNAIHLLPDKDIVIDEARRALDSGGILGFNTSFYEGCYSPGTEKFYRLWMLRSLKILKDDFGIRPGKERSEAMRWLTPDEYRQLLARHRFEVVEMRTEEAMMTCESWQDISHYSLFASGALPGVPLDAAIPALKKSVRQAFDELGLEVVPRNWLQVVARAV
jgi:ubiquinone/menaquinone biosynthesis C-methylase UbiE